jgi:hypothetical protein
MYKYRTFKWRALYIDSVEFVRLYLVVGRRHLLSVRTLNSEFCIEVLKKVI